MLFNPVTVAIALVVGGVIILWAERRKHEERVQTVDELTTLDAVKLGLFQALALIPGTSRSGATIIGGLLSGLSRRTAAEFSFFLAIPALLAATAYDIYKARDEFAAADVEPLIVSCVASFVSALLVTKLLLRFVSSHSFAAFAWYRIVFGARHPESPLTDRRRAAGEWSHFRSTLNFSTSSKFPFPGHARVAETRAHEIRLRKVLSGGQCEARRARGLVAPGGARDRHRQIHARAHGAEQAA